MNELPKSERFKRENNILTGLWYGKDPEFNMLDNDKIHMQLGDTMQEYTVRMLLLSTDSPARCKVLEMTQFNGYFGCTYCYHPGVNLDAINPGGKKAKKQCTISV